MPEPTQDPMREVETDWGLLYATCVHPDRVRFSTDLTADSGESSLAINRITYSFSIVLTRGEIPNDRRRSLYRPVDDTWQSDSDWYYLKRHGSKGDPTPTASRAVHDELLPVLAEWLSTDEASDLLTEGAARWRRRCQRLANDAEHKLSKAFQHLQDLRGAVDAGRTLTRDEERFLAQPYVLRFPDERYPEPPSSTRNTDT